MSQEPSGVTRVAQPRSDKPTPLRPKPPALRELAPGNGPSGQIDRPHWAIWRWKFYGGGAEAVTCDAAGDTILDAMPLASGMGQATSLSAIGNHGGIGIVTGSPPGVVGVTLEGCVNRRGVISEAGRRLLAAIPSYAEISPTECGITVIATSKSWLPLREGRLRGYRYGEVIPVTGWHVPGTPGDAVLAAVDLARLAKEVLR